MQRFPSNRRAASAFTFTALALAAAMPARADVAIFGVIDLALNLAKADGVASQKSVTDSGHTSSRLGFRGEEDLGGGLKASFWIESAVTPDTGTSGSTSTNNKDSVGSGGLTWGRRSTLGLEGRFGELRLGRDYVPSFGNLAIAMHPFGTNGVGSSGYLFYPLNANGTTVRTSVRASNAIGYHLPENELGLYGTAMLALGEQPGGTATRDDGRLVGARLGWRSGGWNMAAAASKTRYATGDYLQRNAAVNYRWGPAKLMLLWGDNRVGDTGTRAVMLGTQYTLASATDLRLAYTRLKAERVANDASHWAVGLVHSLSRRTQLYATYARIDNEGEGTRFDNGLGTTQPGGSSQGVDLGIKHSF